jgi:Family of unknown function (DUF695)
MEAEQNGDPIITRFREFPREFPRWKYPCRLNIVWKMTEADTHGLPTGEEFSRLETFEDRLIDAAEHDEHSILLGVLTGNGEREFIFQTRDVSGFLQRLTNMPQKEDRYPITIYRNDDPDWSYFESGISEDPGGPEA